MTVHIINRHAQQTYMHTHTHTLGFKYNDALVCRPCPSLFYCLRLPSPPPPLHRRHETLLLTYNSWASINRSNCNTKWHVLCIRLYVSTVPQETVIRAVVGKVPDTRNGGRQRKLGQSFPRATAAAVCHFSAFQSDTSMCCRSGRARSLLRFPPNRLWIWQSNQLLSFPFALSLSHLLGLLCGWDRMQRPTLWWWFNWAFFSMRKFVTYLFWTWLNEKEKF